MDDGAIGAISVHREPTRVQAWLSRLFPIAVTFIVLMILWYGAAIYFNLRYLNIHMQDVDPNAWNRLSTGDKVRQALSTGQPLMPTPIQTIGDFITRLSQKPTAAGGLWVDVYWTGHAAVLGFLLGTFIGIALAVVFMSSRLLARSLMPFVVASQTIPIVALVPAIMVSAYLAFFSITISTYKGLQSVQPLAFELMRSYAANPRQVFLKLRLPAALPFLFTGLKIGVTASLVGAIIAELPSGSPHGLGQALLNASQYSLNILLWSTVLSAALLGLALYGAVVIAERVIVRWHVENPA
jgi:NitT/TauT family transport system permease protein